MASIIFLGDVMLGRLVSDEIGRRAPASFWGTTRSVLGSADLVIANLECAITTHSRKWSATPKVFYFRADPRAIRVLEAGHVGYVTLANNHTLDFGVRGLLDTLDHLDRAGIACAGAGRNLAEARRPAFVEAAGLRMGILAATDNEPAFAAGENEPGTNYLALRPDPAILGPIVAAARTIKADGRDLVVFSVHWGPNMVPVPPERFRQIAHALIDGGVDIVHGHSAHLFQGVEAYEGGLVLYDTGDFLDDYAVDPILHNDWSFIFSVEVRAGRFSRLTLRPVKLGFARVDQAEGDERAAIMALMRERSRAVGTVLEEDEEGLWLGRSCAITG